MTVQNLRSRIGIAAVLALALMTAAPVQAGSTYHVALDGSSLASGTDALLILQLANGGPPFQEVTASVSNFASDNLTLGSTQTSGDVTDSAGTVAMDNLGTLNFFLQNVQFGTGGMLSFDVTLGGALITAPDGNMSESGTAFAVDLLDPNTNLPLFAGSNPNDGSSAGLTVAAGTGMIQSYDDRPFVTVTGATAVPEPATIVMTSLGLLAVAWRARRAGGRAKRRTAA